MVEKVFFALEGSGTDKKIDWPYVLISAATLWTGKKFKQFRPHENVKEIFLDSGGFSFFLRSGDYEFYPLQYVRLAKKLNAKYVAVLDYPCEPQNIPKRAEYLKTNIQRIERTIENAIKLMDLAPDLPWVFVLQGYNPQEYLYSIDRAKEQGLLTDVVGIGTLCARKSINEARQIITMIKKELPRRVKLHGFGIDLRFIRDSAIFHALYSVDTGAWKGFMPMREIEKLQYFAQYGKKVLDVLEYMRAQTYWDEHWWELIPKFEEGG